MNWLRRLRNWWWDIRNLFEESWDSSFPEIPDDLGCPDTEPTSPGALDSDLARLK